MLRQLRAHDPERQGVMYITMTGKIRATVERAIEGQHTWMRHVRSPDRAVHVCDPEQRHERRLRSVLVLPEDVTPTICPEKAGGDQNRKCTGYDKAQMKLPYALVYMYRQLASNASASLPEWWVLKDDDTYIDSENLHLALSAYDSSRPLVIARKHGCNGICGGTGIVLSWKVAEEVARNGDEFIAMFRRFLETSNKPQYDRKILKYIRKFVPETTFVLDMNFETVPLFNKWCLEPGQLKTPWGVTCHKWPQQDPICHCAPTDRPVSWHVKYDTVKDFRRLYSAYDRSRLDNHTANVTVTAGKEFGGARVVSEIRQFL